jgi:CheY-like chemotaxis protein
VVGDEGVEPTEPVLPVPRKRVLVADDDRHVVRFVKTCLEGAGYIVLTAYDGKEAVKIAREERPDLLLVDVWMPWGMGGPLFERPPDEPVGCVVVKALRTDPSLAHTPVILLATFSSGAERGHACADLADRVAYLYKPFSRQQLLSRVADPRPGDPSQHDFARHSAEFDRDTGRTPPIAPAARRPGWRWRSR